MYNNERARPNASPVAYPQPNETEDEQRLAAQIRQTARYAFLTAITANQHHTTIGYCWQCITFKKGWLRKSLQHPVFPGGHPSKY